MSYAATATISFAAGVALAAVAMSGQHAPAPMPQAVETFSRVVRVPVSDENQCFVTARSMSSNFRALIDTGADGFYLNRSVAVLLGFNPARLAFNGRVGTALGEDRTASVRLPELNVSGFVLRNVEASVRYGNLDYPLIGLSILKRLGRFEVAHGNCSLMW
jgi:aspartyl protease family protein